MWVEQIPVNNALRNYMYLLACPETKQAFAVDPLDHKLCLEIANKLGFTITGVLNTHEHYDHIGGNAPVIDATGALLYAHHKANIPNVDVLLTAGQVIRIGTSVELTSLDTPGHTFCHSCFYYQGNTTQAGALFSGDTLFNAGVGNCRDGNASILYDTFAQQIFTLNDDTIIYPGHDYLLNNLRFTLSREPNNTLAQSWLSALTSDKAPLTTIGIERQINTFFRLDNQSIIDNLSDDFSRPGDKKSVFLALRKLRDTW